MDWSASRSRKTWIVPLVGNRISSSAIFLAPARPIVWRSGLAPKLLPEEMWR
jgi:hypothetical protein